MHAQTQNSKLTHKSAIHAYTRMYKHLNLLKHTLEKRLFLLADRYTHVHSSLSLSFSRSLALSLFCSLALSCALSRARSFIVLYHIYRSKAPTRSYHIIIIYHLFHVMNMVLHQLIHLYPLISLFAGGFILISSSSGTPTTHAQNTHIFTHTSIHTRAIARTHKHTRHARTHTLVYFPPSIEYVHVHAYTRTGTYTHMHTRTRARSHKHSFALSLYIEVETTNSCIKKWRQLAGWIYYCQVSLAKSL